jgi:hypothetical protein
VQRVFAEARKNALGVPLGLARAAAEATGGAARVLGARARRGWRTAAAALDARGAARCGRARGCAMLVTRQKVLRRFW